MTQKTARLVTLLFFLALLISVPIEASADDLYSFTGTMNGSSKNVTGNFTVSGNTLSSFSFDFSQVASDIGLVGPLSGGSNNYLISSSSPSVGLNYFFPDYNGKVVISIADYYWTNQYGQNSAGLVLSFDSLPGAMYAAPGWSDLSQPGNYQPGYPTWNFSSGYATYMPEPSALVLTFTGLMGLGSLRRRAHR